MNTFLTLDLIFFILVAVFLIIRLRSVLGRRTGNEKKTGSDFSFDAKVIDKNSKNIESIKTNQEHIKSSLKKYKNLNVHDDLKKIYIIFILFLCLTKSLIAEQILYLENNFFPEGITISKNGDIYVGSLKENKIVKFKNKKKDSELFVSSNSNGLMSVIGILADDRNKILWACSSNPGVTNYPSDNSVSLKAFDLNTGEPLQSYEFPNSGFCNDITLDTNDNIYVTDSFNPRILRLNKSQSRLETWFENDAFKGEGFNLNGITFIDNHIYTVKMNSGELFKIDVGDNGKPLNFTKIDLPRPLNAPDGIKAINKN